MHAHRSTLLGLLLAACAGDPPAADEGPGSSGAAATTAGGETSPAPTTGAPDAGSSGSTSGTTASSSGGESSTGDPPPPALPPLEQPVVMTDAARRVPTHAVDAERVVDVRIPEQRDQAMADGYGQIELQAGEPVLPLTLDGAEPPAPGPAPQLLARFVHLADTQLTDDESPARLVNFDQIEDGAFRPQEAHLCRMLDAAARTINRVHVDAPVDFVLLGGDNVDNAQANELEWFMGILDGAPEVECDSAIDDDPVPGPGNDPKDRFTPVGLDVPWLWVTGNHDILRQGNWPVADWMGEPTGSTAVAGTRDWSQPGGPIVTGSVPSDPARTFLGEAEMLQRVAAGGDGHGITADALALGRAFYTFDVAGTPLRLLIFDTAAATGGATGLVRQVDVDAILEPALQQAAADGKAVIVTSHHRADRLSDGNEQGIGEEFADALTPDEFVALLGGHPHVLLHLAAHSHTMHVQPRAPMGGHAYWEVASPALADFPSQMRLLEVWDQDNGFLSIRALAFDFVADDDPIADEGRALAVADYTTAWRTTDGRGMDPEDRNVELWIAAP
ncbi:MAG: metallophosphoesterase [Myxococcales bacterium]|nr:metallophosphoesterase [Myxococcales bacterium]